MKWYYLLAIPAINAILNGYHFFRLRYIKDKYFEWLLSGKDGDIIAGYSNELKMLLKKANIKDCYIPESELIGCGQVANFQLSAFEQFPSRRKDIASILFMLISRGLGVYKNNFYNSFNPIFWLEIIVYLPKGIFSYLGISDNTMIVKILQLIWWVIGGLITAAIALYPDFCRQSLEWLVQCSR